jgi:hypothetical protein
VILKAPGAAAKAALLVTGKAVVVRGLTVTGPRRGIELAGGSGATLERIVARDCGEEGVAADKAELVLRDALITRNHLAGVKLIGGRGTVERSTLSRNLPPDAAPPGALYGDWGAGLYAFGDVTLAIRDTVVTGNHFGGVILEARCEGTIERSVVRNTLPRCAGDPPHCYEGIGINLQPD